ncbi:MAG: HEAT repeat domain-containing protein [Sandaracinaceae bacterium]|nr:HEAT repeat domain-containing protein [Sandaracinaceae bacterium]MBK8410036.1 HEAT repeat domain-containing protein [Sandaracinaceae bacterium]MBK8591925.1 HEAT repeat domain-containing protein [Sandaracinaceae bacterium]
MPRALLLPPASFFTLAALGVLLGACGGDTPAVPSAAPAVSGLPAPSALVVLSDAERARVPEVLAELRNGSFSRSVVIRDNARVLLWLAETSTDPSVTTAALRGLLTTWTHSPRYAERMALVSPEYATIVLRRMGDDHPGVQAAAIKASIKCLLGESPHTGVAARLSELATRHPSAAGRLEALEALWHSSVIVETPSHIAPFVAALDAPEPWLVSGSLFRLGAFGAGWPDQGTLRARLRELLAHVDPGVRGRAATALSTIVGPQDADRDAVAQAILPLLRDAHAYPRSAAATALAWLDYRPAVPELVALLDDSASNVYDLRDFTLLDGTPGLSHHDGSPWSRVDDAALRALQSFSSRLGTRFTFDVQHERVDTDLAAAGSVARAWYQGVRSELPPG